MNFDPLSVLKRIKRDFVAPPYDSELHKPESYYAQAYLRHLGTFLTPEGRPLRVLDAGCGTGRFAMELARMGCAVTAVDYSKTSLAILRQKAREQNLDISIHHASLADFVAQHTSEYDAVICLEVLYTSEDRLAATRMLCQALKPAGIALITHKPRHYFLLKALKEGHWDDAKLIAQSGSGSLRKGNHRVHYNWQSRADIEALYKQVGVELMTLKAIGPFSGFSVDPLASICDPESLSASELEMLSAIESISEVDADYLMSSRYVLAVARRPA